MVGHNLLENYSWITLYFLLHEGGSIVRVCHTGRRKRKGLEISCKYIYYKSTKDPAFILAQS